MVVPRSSTRRWHLPELVAAVQDLPNRFVAWLVKERHLHQSRQMDVSGLRSVCLMLGPYRNLTTLTGSLLFLHPHCQVLNHGGVRIFGDKRVDFLADYSDETFDAFLRYAIFISESGARGDYGGSITFSHAWDDRYVLNDLSPPDRHPLIKSEIHSLVWKESLRTANHIRACNTPFDDILAANPLLRFLQPIRNPLDCALSNHRNGKGPLFEGLDERAPPEDVLDAILAEYEWFEELRLRHPDRFLRFFQYELNEGTLRRIATFLRLDIAPAWLDAAVEGLDIRGGRAHEKRLVDHYRGEVERRFTGNPDFAEALLRFVDGHA